MAIFRKFSPWEICSSSSILRWIPSSWDSLWGRSAGGRGGVLFADHGVYHDRHRRRDRRQRDHFPVSGRGAVPEDENIGFHGADHVSCTQPGVKCDRAFGKQGDSYRAEHARQYPLRCRTLSGDLFSGASFFIYVQCYYCNI